MKQKNNFINDLLKFTSKDYIFDLYESRYIIPSGVKSAEYYINNTLDLYFEYHKKYPTYNIRQKRKTTVL